MRFSGVATVLLAGMLTQGCIVSDKNSKQLVTVGGKRDLVSSFDKCKKLLTLIEERKPHSDDYVIQKSYRYGKSCVRLHIGMYGNMQRLAMTDAPLFLQRNAGNFATAQRLLSKSGITCQENAYSLLGKKELDLVFPKGHRDYRNISMTCKESDILHVQIGLNEKDGDRLAITVESRKEGRDNIYDAFDTNARGVIKKHITVVGAGGDKRVVLDE